MSIRYRILLETLDPTPEQPENLRPSTPGLSNPLSTNNLSNTSLTAAHAAVQNNFSQQTTIPNHFSRLTPEGSEPSPLLTTLYPTALDLPTSTTRVSTTETFSSSPANTPFIRSFAQAETNPVTLTRAEVRQMIDETIQGLKIYVLESDITQAQKAVKSIVELASF